MRLINGSALDADSTWQKCFFFMIINFELLLDDLQTAKKNLIYFVLL